MIASPLIKLLLGVFQIENQMNVQALIPQTAIGALTVVVLDWLIRQNEGDWTSFR